eukprot:TRINITY_DN84478_c0_g1_i1.p1 TRINITY_DN84478_c0_g1~~TRINITY_DN84478_c0_g1_i1.p1  ORF type:complete len:467 (-),score=48.77 TRINITY_DN84478_c0_g1_i1:308-1708(-)
MGCACGKPSLLFFGESPDRGHQTRGATSCGATAVAGSSCSSCRDRLSRKSSSQLSSHDGRHSRRPILLDFDLPGKKVSSTWSTAGSSTSTSAGETASVDSSPCWEQDSDVGEEYQAAVVAVTGNELQETMEQISREVLPWGGEFATVRTLQEARRNYGRVDLMTSARCRNFVAAKRMPTQWVCTEPAEFIHEYPKSTENPWVDLAMTKLLVDRGCEHVNRCLGVFRDLEGLTYVLSPYASRGDLLGWCLKAPRPGSGREQAMMPLAVQLLSAVEFLQDHDICHRDLSLENALLLEGEDGSLQIKLIDFGMAMLGRTGYNMAGKERYRAPEMHDLASLGHYNTFAADIFALGIMLFSMAVQDYPWNSSKKGECLLFEYYRRYGFVPLLQRRRLGRQSTSFLYLVDVLSTDLAQLLAGMLQVSVRSRTSLGASASWCACCAKTAFWEQPWLVKAAARPARVVSSDARR